MAHLENGESSSLRGRQMNRIVSSTKSTERPIKFLNFVGEIRYVQPEEPENCPQLSFTMVASGLCAWSTLPLNLSTQFSKACLLKLRNIAVGCGVFTIISTLLVGERRQLMASEV